jgi:2,3-dihydroxybiphenyl 1,2-dioxygenase
MDIIGIGYLGFEAPDPAAWREFGNDILGTTEWTSPEAVDDTVYLRMDDRRYRMAIHPGGDHRLAYIGWELKGRTGFEAAVATLEAAGVPVEMGDAELCRVRAVTAVARFKDPVGYQHEIFFAQKWGFRSFSPPSPRTGFDCGDDGDQGLGHVVLAAPDYNEELETFLREVMGFRWYGYGGGPGVGFWGASLNKRSHVIAYIKVPGMIGIQHMGVYVRTIDDVGIAYDAALKKDAPLQQTLGRHTQDPVISFYAVAPAGCAVEYIWELDRFGQLGFETSPERVSLWGHKLVGTIMGTALRPVATPATREAPRIEAAAT